MTKESISWNAYKKKKKNYNVHKSIHNRTSLNIQYSHAGRLDISAVTARGILKFKRAPLMIPRGKFRCMLVACAALFSAGGL